ncbi:MAG: hypothetical protein ACFFD4_32165 [Candidatus Odinarchaeota archaeon]
MDYSKNLEESNSYNCIPRSRRDFIGCYQEHAAQMNKEKQKCDAFKGKKHGL